MTGHYLDNSQDLQYAVSEGYLVGQQTQKKNFYGVLYLLFRHFQTDI